MSSTTMSSIAIKHTTPQREDFESPTIIVAIPSPNARPEVPAVIGVCGHPSRSVHHTCGAYACTERYMC